MVGGSIDSGVKFCFMCVMFACLQQRMIFIKLFVLWANVLIVRTKNEV